MKIEKRLLALNTFNTGTLRKLDECIIDKIIEVILQNITSYKLNQYTYIFSDNSISKKDVKKTIILNNEYIEKIKYTKVSDNIINVVIDSGSVRKIPYIHMYIENNFVFVKYYKKVFKNIFEDAVYKYIDILDDHTVLVNDTVLQKSYVVLLTHISISDVDDNYVIIKIK